MQSALIEAFPFPFPHPVRRGRETRLLAILAGPRIVPTVAGPGHGSAAAFVAHHSAPLLEDAQHVDRALHPHAQGTPYRVELDGLRPLLVVTVAGRPWVTAEARPKALAAVYYAR